MDENRLVKDLLDSMHSLLRSMHKLNIHSDCADLSMLQMHTLLYIRERGPASMKELSDMQKMQPATTTALIDRLVAKNLLKRETDAVDRRVTRVGLTPTGLELLGSIYEQKQQQTATFLEILDTAEQEELVRLMRKIDAHFLELLEKKEYTE
ncbi:hypothetical protein COW46_03215 [Candidatus Gracilibacteria bacterium CG17_big_fil_post_rev_8_21_14_2_50_48_13]|nr:MAG: hypothetical protein COW46_03215 [Candidatus Gracilibacteria bacterium CG17_big_fil_post_rev_8_21_14_2_50_48_13]